MNHCGLLVVFFFLVVLFEMVVCVFIFCFQMSKVVYFCGWIFVFEKKMTK